MPKPLRAALLTSLVEIALQRSQISPVTGWDQPEVGSELLPLNARPNFWSEPDTAAIQPKLRSEASLGSKSMDPGCPMADGVPS